MTAGLRTSGGAPSHPGTLQSQWPALRDVAAMTAVATLLWCSVAGAQTVITAPANRYSAAEDVQIGRQAAAQVAQQLPVLEDREVTSPIESIPRDRFSAYQSTFRRVVGSIQLK